MENKGIEVRMICMSEIMPSPDNPRKTFDECSIVELSENIARQGLLQPITVRPKDDAVLDEDTLEVIGITRYEIVCGERRFRAFRMLREKNPGKYGSIPCIVKNLTDEEAFEASITENLSRQDVDPVEEGVAFSLLVEKGQKVEDISAKFGKTVRFIQDRIKLGSLVPKIHDMIRDGLIPLSGALMVAKLDKEVQEKFADTYKGKELTVNDVRSYIDNRFGILTSAQFYKDGEDSIEGFVPCSKCEKNTSNYSCLFWEMKGDNPKCTDISCMNRKQNAYVVSRILKEKCIVHIGEPLEFGQTVVISEGEQSWWTDDRKKAYSDILHKLSENRIAVVDASVFNGRCHYAEDDSRIASMLERNEVYRCISIDSSSGFRYGIAFYYVRKSSSTQIKTGVDQKEKELDKLQKKLKGIKEDTREKVFKGLNEIMLKGNSYRKIGSEITQIEQTVFDALLLLMFDNEYLSSLGIDKFSSKEDFVEYVRTHPEDRKSWYREFIVQRFGQNRYPVVYRLQMELVKEMFPEEFNAINARISKSYNRDFKKLNERIKELEGA